MKDVQNSQSLHNIFINKVGVKGVEFPLLLDNKNKESITVHATFDLFASLHGDLRGTNMSRFVEHLMNYHGKSISTEDFIPLLTKLCDKIESDDVYIQTTFKYPIFVNAPVSSKKSIYYCKCSFISMYSKKDINPIFTTEIEAIGTALCPCSKEISTYGAHNQRSKVNLSVTQELTNGMKRIWLEDLLNTIQACFSCKIYPLLKRSDEKYVTEKAYSNPRFVEDIAREVANKIIRKYGNGYFFKQGNVKVENYESIHLHNAYSEITF